MFPETTSQHQLHCLIQRNVAEVRILCELAIQRTLFCCFHNSIASFIFFITFLINIASYDSFILLKKSVLKSYLLNIIGNCFTLDIYKKSCSCGCWNQRVFRFLLKNIYRPINCKMCKYIIEIC